MQQAFIFRMDFTCTRGMLKATQYYKNSRKKKLHILSPVEPTRSLRWLLVQSREAAKSHPYIFINTALFNILVFSSDVLGAGKEKLDHSKA